MTTYPFRQRCGRNICRALAERIERTVPSEIAAWSGTQAIVGPASATFLTALAAWEAEGSTEARERLGAAYRSVVAAWERAAAEHRRHA